MNLKDLQKPIGIEYIYFMPARVNAWKENVYLDILAYKDARVDMKILDEVCGTENWTNEYKRDSKGVLQCGIGIYIEARKEWVWKWSNGTESAFEKAKGEYSDAFKRAGFMWGIGRQLYEMPKIRLTLAENEYYDKAGKPVVSPSLQLNNENLFRWELSEDYQSVRLEKNYNGEWKNRINTQPFKKKYQNA